MTARRREIRVLGLNEPISHYTDAVAFDSLLFISGCAPLDADGNLVGRDDVVAQARRALWGLGQVLDQAGSGFEHVLKVTVYLTDIGDRSLVNPVRQEFFGAARSASTLVEVSALAVPGMKFEIDAVAAIPDRGADDR
jgi:2-iminobutanoate/2-iminopropanoate deaminase